eukprot:TRINITY_DN46560_c0_g1_i1.p1 TRINITY_DN46560_c0_g1~~TRINITY_DN46560_c0_g1_i1.p1  ORF type:complete len:195 (+),score=5.53 TRINITY_DN46560_c0_g1_i1:26-610(+)
MDDDFLKRDGGDETEELLSDGGRRRKRERELDVERIIRDRLTEAKNELDLSGLGMGDAELAWLLRELQHRKDIDIITLSGNLITDEGAQDLALFLQADTNVHSIDLYDNKLRDKGIKAICDALLCNTTLKMLDIRANNCTSKGHESIRTAQDENAFVAICHDYDYDSDGDGCWCAVMCIKTLGPLLHSKRTFVS